MRTALLALAFSAAALPAAADDFIVADNFIAEGSYLDLRAVQSSQDGIVAVVEPGSGRVLAEAPVHAGTNVGVRLRFTLPLRTNAVAVLVHDGVVVDTRTLNIVDRDSPFLRDD